MSAETTMILVAIFGGITVQIAVLVTVVRGDRLAKELRGEIDKLRDDVNKRCDKRFDETIRKIAEQRERMAELEGFLASRRDRDAA